MVRTSMVPMLLVCGCLAAQAPAADPAVTGQAPASAPAKPLSLREAIQTSLQNNLAVEIAQQTREATRANVQVNLGAFDWTLGAALQGSRLESASNAPQGAKTSAPVLTTATATNRSLSADLSKPFQWGGSLDLNYSPQYSYQSGTTSGSATPGINGPWNTYYPYGGSLTATYNQNLLQGFGRDVATAPLVIARKNSAAADYTFQLAIINLVANTESQYWQVVFGQRNLANKQIALDLAQKQLKENQIKLQVGTMAPIDVTSAEAQVAQAEQDIITAQATLDNARDALVRALYPNAERPGTLELTDAPTLGHIQLDEAAAVRMALERRVELKSARIAKEVSDLQLTVAQDKVKPQLGAFVSYNGGASNYDSFSSVNSDLAGAKYPGYTVGLKLSMPLENNAASGGLAAARANLRNSELGLRDQELSITLDVRTAIRNVESTEKGVKAAAKTRYFQEKNLEAEQKKFDNGMSTNFTVLQIMTNLDAARSAETQAQINYANAVTAMEKAVGNLLEARNFAIK